MDSPNSQVSFIPKGSLVREESFLERRRPRSIAGVIAAFVFFTVFSAYIALYYYNNSLTQVIAEKTAEIRKLQREFDNAPEVGEAKVFRARTDLARELLDAHTIVSPVLAFLSKNTVESVLYEKFSFKSSPDGAIVELSGEAPTYASLAYQSDILRKQNKELVGFSVKDIALTKFGTVTFTFILKFNREYLLYVKNMGTTGSIDTKVDRTFGVTPAFTGNTMFATTSTSTFKMNEGRNATSTLLEKQRISTSSVSASSPINSVLPSVGSAQTGVSVAIPAVAEKQSFLKFLWLKFKFW